ncbi:MAG: hypothetical protein AB1761_18850 [Pseudomonadota bacterium]
MGDSATERQSEMNATAALPVVGIDLAENGFEVAVADERVRIVERARPGRAQFERWFANRGVGQVVMKARGAAHHWGRGPGHRGEALADTLARICFALLRDGVDYGTARVNRQLARETCALPA